MARLAIALIAAGLGCDATLGSGGDTHQDAPAASDARADSAATDAPPDARTCTGGNAAALAPDGSCLVHVTTAVTYANAKAGCAALGMGAHLAFLENASIDTFAETFIGSVDTWIGGNDLVTENAFVWDDGTAFNFTNWATNEPNNGGAGAYQEDCVLIAGARATKQWDDRPCDATEVPTSGTFAYLCQY
jgi:hypothetical protein